MKLNRDEFLETGYLIVKEAVPRDKLERVRQAYETLVDRQRENWKAERADNDPPGGVWETAPQPRLQLSRSPLVNQIDQETAPAVEVWLEENIHGVSTELLDVSDGAVTEMMMMCNPVRDHGPAKWHRDHHPIDTAPLQGYIDDILEGGPRYVQWNIPLYDDSVLWVIPGSHLRLNTSEENELLLADPCRPLPNGVQTHLEAGDGVVYILPILHWGSNYSPKMRRTIHGGFSTHTSIDDLSFTNCISPQAQEAFARWSNCSEQMKQHTEDALRAVLSCRWQRVSQRPGQPPSVASRKRQNSVNRIPLQGGTCDSTAQRSPASGHRRRPPASPSGKTSHHAQLGIEIRRTIHL